MQLDKNMIERINKINWFSACGKECSIPGTEPCMKKEQMMKSIQSISWENRVLDFEGDFTEQLCVSFNDKYSEWNNMADELKKLYMPHLEEAWKAKLEEAGLNENAIFIDVQFNVIGMIMIDAYKELLPTPPFFQKLLEIYESGHIPCGWKGKKADGMIRVY